MPTQLNPVAAALPTTPVANAADATGNYIIPGNADVLVRINNGSAVSTVVTLNDPTTPNPEGSGAVTTPSTWPDVAITIAAGAARTLLFNKARRARFVNPANGRIEFSTTPVTTVTFEVYAV